MTEQDNKVYAFLKFMEMKTTRQIAEFAVNLQNTIDGLTESKEEFVIAYRELLDKSWKADCSTCKEMEKNMHNRICKKCKHKEREDFYQPKSAIPGAAGNSPAESGYARPTNA